MSGKRGKRLAMQERAKIIRIEEVV